MKDHVKRSNAALCNLAPTCPRCDAAQLTVEYDFTQAAGYCSLCHEAMRHNVSRLGNLAEPAGLRVTAVMTRKPRTIQSLIRQCFKRYPVPMTAWQVGHIIKRNPASVSSQLHRMANSSQKAVISFLGDKAQVLYAPLTCSPDVQRAYSGLGDLTPYRSGEYGDQLTRIKARKTPAQEPVPAPNRRFSL